MSLQQPCKVSYFSFQCTFTLWYRYTCSSATTNIAICEKNISFSPYLYEYLHHILAISGAARNKHIWIQTLKTKKQNLVLETISNSFIEKSLPSGCLRYWTTLTRSPAMQPMLTCSYFFVQHNTALFRLNYTALTIILLCLGWYSFFFCSCTFTFHRFGLGLGTQFDPLR